MVADFREVNLRLELNLVGEQAAGRRRPVGCETVVARDPFSANVSVNLNAVRVAVVGGCRNRVI